MKIDKDNIGKRLSELMDKKGYSNGKLTAELNLSKNIIGNIKNNTIPGTEILFTISQKLGTSMEYILTGEENYNSVDADAELLLQKYNQLSDQGKHELSTYLEFILTKDENLNAAETSSTSMIG